MSDGKQQSSEIPSTDEPKIVDEKESRPATSADDKLDYNNHNMSSEENAPKNSDSQDKIDIELEAIERAQIDLDEVEHRPDSLPPEVEQCISEIQPFKQELNSVIRSCENLKLLWVDKQFQVAFYRNWEHLANQTFRKRVLMRWREKYLKNRSKSTDLEKRR